MSSKRMLLLMFALLFAACEGNVMVEGSVIDAETKLPIDGAVAWLSVGGDPRRPDTSRAAGDFVVGSGLVGMVCGPPRTTLTVERAGYKRYTREFKSSDERGVVVELEAE